MHVAKKNSNAVKSSVSLKQNQFGRLHWRTVNFFSFKGRYGRGGWAGVIYNFFAKKVVALQLSGID